ncbi:MAG: 3-dehydroquinate synthase [Prevotellaceae bacterium]|jgi:3-dehydroquinate synthase|nr:3-dehydroquinate synthase [Prevotellaceae bacterium]
MTLKLPDGRTSLILTGESIGNLSAYINAPAIYILTNQDVYDLYGSTFPKNASVFILPSGEKNKTMNTVVDAVRQLIEKGADRKSFIVGIGGGIVCDITGFISSIYMRGLRFAFVPTTLMAQVDASVGGKNGVNCDGYKNMIGVFNQPDFVLCDTETLKTLNDREFKSGLSEVVKSGLIADASLFNYLENNVEAIMNRNSETLNHIVEKSIRIKAKIVENDEKESGERKKLNLGHTFGHAIEKRSDNICLHGEAVSLGLIITAKISKKLNLLSENDFDRIVNLLKNIGLPIYTDIPVKELIETAGKDKKKQGNTLHFVLNRGIGNAEIAEISYRELEQLIESCS